MGTTQRIAEVVAIFDGRFEFADLGQLSKAQQRRLQWAAKHGIVTKERAAWPWKSLGCCIKTFYTLRRTA